MLTEINNNKILNCRCYCNVGLPWIKGQIIMAYPCEHMFHEKCYEKMDNVCKICNTKIETKITLFDKNIHYQHFADILSMTYFDHMSHSTVGKFVDSFFDLASVLIRIPFAKNIDNGKLIAENVFSLNNLTLKVYNYDKLKSENKKVFICNHVSHLEMIILYYLLSTGFLASSIVGKSSLVEQITKVVPLLTFDRGDKNRKNNIVDEMKKFVDKNGSICLFPEGIMKHPDTLVRFRTGAFHVGHPIYSIVIKHNDVISDGHLNRFIYKLSGKQNINMSVHILGPYYPPFTEQSIEKIRHDMAKVGNMILSRVSNRDIDDKVINNPI